VNRPSTIHSFAISVLLANPGAANFSDAVADRGRLGDAPHHRAAARAHGRGDADGRQAHAGPGTGGQLGGRWSLITKPDVDEETRNRFVGAWDQHRRVFGYKVLPELPDLLRRALDTHEDLKGLDFDMLVVDEYQDLNACDLRALAAAARRHGTAVFGVGDDERRSTRRPDRRGASRFTWRTRRRG
jgi:DNA helicase-2/ATP-dependent DNA helicase PcrA